MNNEQVNHVRIDAALKGQLDTTDLTEREEAIWREAFIEKMGYPSKAEIDFHRRRKALRQCGCDDFDGKENGAS